MRKAVLWMIVLGCIVISSGFAEEVLYSGELGGEGRSRALRGSWQIIENDEGERVLILGEDFKARSGPDLKIFFSKLPLRRIHDRNAGAQVYSVRISRLKSSRGEQEYPLPDSLDLSVYKTWVVHCEAYSHFWDGAELIDESEEEEEKAEEKEEPSEA